MRKFKKPTPEQIQAGIERDAQHWADVTQQPTVAFSGNDGIVRFQRGDFPVSGKVLTIKTPVVNLAEAA